MSLSKLLILRLLIRSIELRHAKEGSVSKESFTDGKAEMKTQGRIISARTEAGGS